MWLTSQRFLRALSGMNRRKTPRRSRVWTYRPRLEALEDRTLLSAYVVTTTADSGPGSLRDAITQVNADANHTLYASPSNPNVDEIDFNITAASDAAAGGTGYNATTGVATIKPQTALPSITNSVIIDGYTQSGASPNTLAGGDNAALKIDLDGSQAGTSAVGLDVNAQQSVVRGLDVTDWGNYGILLDTNSSNSTVAGNFVGTDVTGESARPNGSGPLLVFGVLDNAGIRVNSANNLIGGADPASRNVVSGNAGDGIFMFDYDTYASQAPPTVVGNHIEGNFIGTDAKGTKALANTDTFESGFGIISDYGRNNTIGGTVTGAGNLISGNQNDGIQVADESGDAIQGNKIGTDVTGEAALPNGTSGQFPAGVRAGDDQSLLIGGTAPGAGNLISGNDGYGLWLEGPSAPTKPPTSYQVEGNLIGTDIMGTTSLGNQQIGVYVETGTTAAMIGGTTAGSGNVISGNSGDGVFVTHGATSVSILGNSIHDNGGPGIRLDSATNANDNQAAPVLISASSSSSGTMVSGTLASVPNTTFRIEFFSNAGLDGSGNAEGQTYLGFALVSTDANGNASFTATNLAAIPAGQSYLTATATVATPNGDGTYTYGNTSQFSSNPLTPTTTTVLTSSANPSLLNQPVTFTATVSSSFGTPTGSVDFVDTTTGTNLGTVALSSSDTASVTVSNLAVGAHVIEATYAGQGGFPASSGTLSQQVDYGFSGFLPPLSNGLTFGVNRSIPIKFQLTDANGNAITSLSAVTSLQIQVLDANGNPVGAPFNPSGTGLSNSGGTYSFNWQTKNLSPGSYEIVLKLADGTTHTQTIQLTSNGNGAKAQATDGSDVSGGGTAGQLLGGNVELYVDNSNGDLSPDELARIQDAVNAIDATIAPYGVAINEVTDPTQADVTLNMDTTSTLGGYANGVLGVYNTSGAITLIQGWNWYAGADPTQIGSGQYDFQTTVTHELGHALGLGESSDPTSAMYGTLAPATTIRNLTTADLNVPYDEGSSDAQRAAVGPASTPLSGTSSGTMSPATNPLSSSTTISRLLSEAMNTYQSELSSLAALWQRAEAVAWQRFDSLLGMGAGSAAMGGPKDIRTLDILFTSLPSTKNG